MLSSGTPVTTVGFWYPPRLDPANTSTALIALQFVAENRSPVPFLRKRDMY